MESSWQSHRICMVLFFADSVDWIEWNDYRYSDFYFQDLAKWGEFRIINHTMYWSNDELEESSIVFA